MECVVCGATPTARKIYKRKNVEMCARQLRPPSLDWASRLHLQQHAKTMLISTVIWLILTLPTTSPEFHAIILFIQKVSVKSESQKKPLRVRVSSQRQQAAGKDRACHSNQFHIGGNQAAYSGFRSLKNELTWVSQSYALIQSWITRLNRVNNGAVNRC